MTKHKLATRASAALLNWTAMPNDTKIRVALLAAFCIFVLASPVYAAGSNPWEDAVSSLQDSFTGPIAKGLSLIAIVVGGLMFAFGEGGSKKMLSGIIFGLGMVLGAANFMSWLFPSNTP